MKSIITLITLLAISISSYGLDKPDAPKGWKWNDMTEIKGACLSPTNWYFNSFKQPDGLVYTVSPDKTKLGNGVDIGLTINVIKEVEKKSNVPAEKYAIHYLVNYVPKEDFISVKEPKTFGKFRITSAELIRKKDDMRIYLTTYANTETDTLFVITFGTPKSKKGNLSSDQRADSLPHTH